MSLILNPQIKDLILLIDPQAILALVNIRIQIVKIIILLMIKTLLIIIIIFLILLHVQQVILDSLDSEVPFLINLIDLLFQIIIIFIIIIQSRIILCKIT